MNKFFKFAGILICAVANLQFKMKHYPLLIIIVGFVCCCSPKNNVPENTWKINIPDEIIFLSADSVFSSVDYIPLETTKESVMYKIDKMKIYESELYILDQKKNVILVFDKTGKFIRKLDKKGRGPDEYISIDDFFIHNSLIYVLSNASQKILIYDIFFHLKKTYRTETFAHNFEYFGDKIFLYTNFSSPIRNNLYVFNMENGELLNTYKKYDQKQSGVSYTRTIFAKDEECIYAAFPYDYNIYILDEKDETVFITLDFGEKNMFPNELKYFSDDEKDNYKKSRYRNFFEMPIPDIDNLYVSKNLIYFTFIYHAFEYSLFYDRLHDITKFGYLENTANFPVAHSESLFIENDCLYSYVLPENALNQAEFYQSRKESVPAILTSLKPEDNPLICIHRFSKK